MNNNALEQRRAGSHDARKINAALALLDKETRGAAKYGRLIFGLDLTGSRAASLKEARIATAAMFDTLKAIGADRLLVKLVYYRGMDECKTSGWERDPVVLRRAMERLSCKSGGTQIARVLRMVLAEQEPLSGAVFIGDCCEDDEDEVVGLAAKLGAKKIPLYIFHECYDDLKSTLEAGCIFKSMAEASGGACCEFNPDSSAVLRELLSTIAAYSTAGQEGVKAVAEVTTPEAKQLQTRLLLGPAGMTGKRG